MRILLLSAFLSCFYSYSQDLGFKKPTSYTNPTKNFDAQVVKGKNNPLNGLSSWQIYYYRADNGSWSSNLMTYKVYMSKDSIISLDDIIVNQNAIFLDCSKGCNGTTSTAVGFDISCENNLPSGSYYFILKLDAENAIIETNESNNVGYIQFNYTQETCGRVSVYYDGFKNNYKQGEYLFPSNIQISFSNSSSDDLKYFNGTNLYLSKDLEWSFDDYKINYQSFSMYGLGVNVLCSVNSFQIPSYTSSINNTFKICDNNVMLIPNNIPNGFYNIIVGDSKFTNNQTLIYVGPTTGLGKEIESHFFPKVNKIIDLTGKELDIESAEGQIVIILFDNNDRKLTKFYKENFINCL